ncbi:MAG: hypothetical protein K2X82_08405 [Gemmataceae bacterium]|nr:hypothetical protein [Gemmataceae bacterium]
MAAKRAPFKVGDAVTTRRTVRVLRPDGPLNGQACLALLPGTRWTVTEVVRTRDGAVYVTADAGFGYRVTRSAGRFIPYQPEPPCPKKKPPPASPATSGPSLLSWLPTEA